MKRKVAVLITMIVLMPFIASAQVYDLSGEHYSIFKLDPGVYHIGIDIPAGNWDVRFHDLDGSCSISYSDTLDDNGHPDLTQWYSYSFTYYANKWWQGTYAVIKLFDYGYLEVRYSPCTLYEMD